MRRFWERQPVTPHCAQTGRESTWEWLVRVGWYGAHFLVRAEGPLAPPGEAAGGLGGPAAGTPGEDGDSATGSFGRSGRRLRLPDGRAVELARARGQPWSAAEEAAAVQTLLASFFAPARPWSADARSAPPPTPSLPPDSQRMCCPADAAHVLFAQERLWLAWAPGRDEGARAVRAAVGMIGSRGAVWWDGAHVRSVRLVDHLVVAPEARGARLAPALVDALVADQPRGQISCFRWDGPAASPWPRPLVRISTWAWVPPDDVDFERWDAACASAGAATFERLAGGAEWVRAWVALWASGPAAGRQRVVLHWPACARLLEAGWWQVWHRAPNDWLWLEQTHTRAFGRAVGRVVCARIEARSPAAASARCPSASGTLARGPSPLAAATAGGATGFSASERRRWADVWATLPRAAPGAVWLVDEAGDLAGAPRPDAAMRLPTEPCVWVLHGFGAPEVAAADFEALA